MPRMDHGFGTDWHGEFRLVDGLNSFGRNGGSRETQIDADGARMARREKEVAVGAQHPYLPDEVGVR